SEVNGIKISCDERVFRGPGFAGVSALQDRAAVTNDDYILVGSKRDAGKCRICESPGWFPINAAVCRDEQGTARADRDAGLHVGESDGEEVRVGVTCLLFPRFAAIGGGDDRPEGSYGPTIKWILRREGDG